MKFLTAREVRNKPSQFRTDVQREDVVLTVGGKPFAIAVGIEEEDVEETIDLLRRLRSLRAMSRMQRTSEAQGTSKVSAEEVDAEIREARRHRSP